MFHFLSEELNKLYSEDMKKLKTSTVLYGHLGEGRWHSDLPPPLTTESIVQLEAELNLELPFQYKDFLLVHNGCYLFDLLRVAGKRPETFKGLSIEEQLGTPFPLDDMQDYYLRKRTPKDQFIFADSIVKNTYYVFDIDGRVLEIDFRTKKMINSYDDLKTFLFEIVLEGKDNIAKGVFFEFE